MPSFCQLSRLVRRRETSVEGQPQFALRPGPSLAILIITLLAPKSEGALRLPTTYDSHPSHLQSLFNHLSRPWIDLSRPPMT